jgi:hypothetical protein
MAMDLILTLASVFAALGVIFGALYASYKLAKKIDAAIGTDDRGRTISDRLDKVEHQLWENGGSSLADRVNNIEHHVIKVSTEIGLIKDLTLGIHNSNTANTGSQEVLPPVLKKRVSRSKKAS